MRAPYCLFLMSIALFTAASAEPEPAQPYLDMPFVLRVPDATPAAVQTRVVERLKESLARVGVSGPTVLIGEGPASLPFEVYSGPKVRRKAPLAFPQEAHEQGYRIETSAGSARVEAVTEVGLFYGMLALERIIAEASAASAPALPNVEKIEYPAIAMRGFSEDFGRNQLPTIDELKRSIRTLAQFRINTYLWFIEPDHFVYRFDPDLGKNVDRFTFDEIREVVAYAKDYYVEIIPTVELLGHMENTLSDPRYAPLGEIHGGSDLCPACDDSFELVRKMVDEIAPAFDSPYFHCGLDETFSIGTGRSAQAVKEKGVERVFADYYSRLNEHVKSHGKTMMMYADIVLSKPDILPMLPKDIVLMFWDYQPLERFKGLDTLKKDGFKFVSLSGLWDWNNITPVLPPGAANMQVLAAQTKELGGIGHFVSNWGDGYRGAAGFNLNEWAWLGVAYCGEVSWNPKPLSLEEYAKTFALEYFGVADPKLSEGLVRLAKSQGDTLQYNLRARFMYHSDPRMTICMGGPDPAANAFWENLLKESQAAHDLFASVKPARNADVLHAMDLGARMLNYSASLALLCRDTAADLQGDREASAQKFEQMTARSKELWKEYAAIWSTTNRPLNLVELNKVQAWAEERMVQTIADIRAGNLPPRYEKGLRAAFNFDGADDAAWKADAGNLVLAPVQGTVVPVVVEGGPAGKGGFLRLAQGARCEVIDSERSLDFKMAPFLVEAWVRHKGQQEQVYGSSILSFGEGGHGWRLGIDSKNQLLFTLYGVRDAVGVNSIVPADGQWHHVAVNFHECRRADFYVDGKLTDQIDIEGMPDSPGSPLVRVGNEIGLVTPFEGDLDRIRVSAGVFTAAELDSKP